jgi:formylmethanofuran dehydrogenase subunit C
VTALTLRFATKSSERFDLSALTPERLKGMKQKEIEALPIGITRDPAKLGDVFKLKGDDPAKLRLVGTTRVCDNIGRGMKDGEIVVDGDAGAYLGATMRGGKIGVSGSTGPYAGGSMAGGLIEIQGNAGERAGGVVVGEHFGMRGGRLMIGGNAGAVLGERMRRGLIVVGGAASDYAGARMIAGTIVIRGKVGRYAGFNLRRGSLVLSKEPKDLLPTFGDSGVLDFEYLRLLERQLREDGVGIKLRARARRLMGDMAVLGKGEMLILA